MVVEFVSLNWVQTSEYRKSVFSESARFGPMTGIGKDTITQYETIFNAQSAHFVSITRQRISWADTSSHLPWRHLSRLSGAMYLYVSKRICPVRTHFSLKILKHAPITSEYFSHRSSFPYTTTV